MTKVSEMKKLITKYEQEVARWKILIEQGTFERTRQMISRKIMLEAVIQDLKELSEQTEKTDASEVNLPIKHVVSSFIQDWAKENKVNAESVTIGIESGKTHKKYRYLYLYDDEFRAINNMEL